MFLIMKYFKEQNKEIPNFPGFLEDLKKEYELEFNDIFNSLENPLDEMYENNKIYYLDILKIISNKKRK